ncbi:helix-turn-helix domain-containing protein [Chloroflexota bacterium]
MEGISFMNQNPDRGQDMLLKTRVFELCEEKHKDLDELGQTMNISVNQLNGVHQGKYSINQRFIVGALKAFPEYNIGDLFYLTD